MRHDDAGAMQQRLLHRLRLAPQCVGVDGDTTSIAHHLAAGDEDVADGPAIGAPHELQADVAAWRPPPPAGTVDDDVGLLADLERPDAVGHPDRLGAGDRCKLEGLVRAEARRIDPCVASDPGRRRGGAQDVGDVAGVRCIATQGDPAAAFDDVGMATGAQ